MTHHAVTERRIRVLHLIESAGIYGAENVIINLSREMSADGRYEPIVGCIVQSEDEAVDLVDQAVSLGMEAHRFLIANAWVWLHLPQVTRQIQSLGVDVIHCHGYKPAVFAYFMGKMSGVAVMATCHLWFVDATAPWKMRLMIRMEKSLYRHFPAVVAVSEQIREILLKAGVPQTRAHLVRNGIVLDDYEASGRLPRQGESTCVLNIARLTRQKAQRDLVSAARILRDRADGVHVLIAGEGELREELQKQIDEEGMHGTVRLVGFHSDVQNLLNQADIFVLPSLDEGMPISLLEAVAARVPVIVTPVGDIPKLITDEETGIVIAANDPEGLANAIRELSRDPLKRARLAHNAFEKLREMYSSQQMFEKYDAVYRQVLGIEIARQPDDKQCVP